MNNISEFLGKFLKFEKDKNTKTALVIEAIKETTNIKLTPAMLELNNDRVKIKCNPVVRNEIFIHQEEIEKFLKNQKIFLKII